MTKKALYIHGYGSTSKTSSTGKVVEEILMKNGFKKVDFLEYSLKSGKLHAKFEKYDVIVAHSLGAFLTLKYLIPMNVKVILINPCLEPCKILANEFAYELSNNQQNSYKLFTKIISDFKFSFYELENIRAIFSENDELCNYSKFFQDRKFKHLYQISGGHRPATNELEEALIDAINDIKDVYTPNNLVSELHDYRILN